MIRINETKRKEAIAERFRQQRDHLLTECDWRSLPDAPGNRDEWLLYRQQLRDITKLPGFPDKITFPTPPE